MHELLKRQIKKFLRAGENNSAALKNFLDVVDETYKQADIDRKMIERSLEIASREMLEQNRLLSNELDFRRDAETRLEYLANFDELTGLVNRNLLRDRLNQAIASAQRQSQKIAVLVLGLDHFKILNDSLGLNVGNEVLKTMAVRLKNCVRDSDTIARFSNDEFAFVLTSQSDEEIHRQEIHRQEIHRQIAPEVGNRFIFDTFLVEILDRLLKIVSRPLILSDQELQITCSIGLCLFPQDGDSADLLLQHADSAMTQAKQWGRNSFQFYTSDISVNISRRLALQQELRLAIEREEFVLHYQPQVSLRSGHIVGVEALIRWNHPKLGFIPPSHFITLAEETGLIVLIGAWVIQTACRQCKTWQESGCGNFRMAVNLSARQFAQPNLVDFIAQVLRETSLDPALLELELTESLVMSDVDQTISILHEITKLGVQLSIDDFGTGYSSLSYLKRFPIEVLKIDQSFIRDLDSVDGTAIVKAIISMAHSLGMQVIAEGVETEEQCNFLCQNMCDEIQGFFFSKGLAREELEPLLKGNRSLPERLLFPIDKNKRTLLLVDDEPGVLSSLNRLLRRDNYEILTAASGEEGLRLLEQFDVDVIVSDQRMPGMSGIEFFRVTREKYPGTIRIILSGYAEVQAIIDAINEGAVYKFLTKPWDDEKLRWHLKEAFKNKSLENDNDRLRLESNRISQDIANASRQLKTLLQNHQEETRRGQVSLGITREILEYIPAAILGIGDDGIVAFANEAARILFRKHINLLGLALTEVFPDLLHQGVCFDVGMKTVFTLDEEELRITCHSMGELSASQGMLLIITRPGDH